MYQVLKNAIEKNLEAANSPNDSASINFHWNAGEKTWCLSGTTVGGLYWETDDVEATSRKEAEQDAADYLNQSLVPDPFDSLY